jgi:hypothetical protein
MPDGPELDGPGLDGPEPDALPPGRGGPLRFDAAAAKTTVRAGDPWTEPTREPASSYFATY